jgi:hypothetical protein
MKTGQSFQSLTPSHGNEAGMVSIKRVVFLRKKGVKFDQ